MGLSELEFALLQERMKRNCGEPNAEPAAHKSSAEQPSEALIEAECTKILEADGWRSLRTDPVSDRGRGKGFGEVGMADHLYILYGGADEHAHTMMRGAQGRGCVVLWIEYKRWHGGVVSKAQRLWHIKERARGALTLIAGEDFTASVDGFKEWYAKSGLQRRD
jgi:hypothetical protein